MSAPSPARPPAADAAAPRVQLTLFVYGRTTRSQRAVNNLHAICRPLEDPEILVVDVLEDPEAADREKVVATPTLIRRLPPPVRRVVGDLSDREQVLAGLGLRYLDAPSPTSG